MTLGPIEDSGLSRRACAGWRIPESRESSCAAVKQQLLTFPKEDVRSVGLPFRGKMQVQEKGRTHRVPAPLFPSLSEGYAGAVADNDPRDDSDLLAAHLEGDGGAFTIIVARNSSLVWSVALKITGNSTDAADAYQEAFLAVYRSASSFMGKSSLTTWLYRITVNAALSQRRKKQKITVHQAITDDDFAAVPEARAKPFADQVDVCLDVSEALSSLSEDQQRAVVLVDMFGYSQVEAAEVLQIPEGTVKSRISRARKTLARDLQHLSPGMRSRRAGQGQEDVRDD